MPKRRIAQAAPSAADAPAPRPKRRSAAREAESKRDDADAVERSDDSDGAADEADDAALPARRGKFDTSMCKPCAGCSGKAKVDCEHRRCLKCCMHLGRACAGHRELIRRREEENRLLNKQPAAHARAATAAAAGDAAAATATSGSPARGPRKPAMTTTIWCLRDFLANRAFSEDILNAQRRARRVGSSDRELTAAAHGARRDARLERALSRLRAAR